MGTATLTNNTASVYLLSYFNGGGYPLTYSIYYNPYGNAYLSGNYLYVPGNYRNTTYNVNVSGTDSGGVAYSSFTVTESGLPAPSLSTIPALAGMTSTGAATFNMTAYLTAGGAITWSATGLPTGMSINSSTGIITGQQGYASYTNITVTATNAVGAASKTFSIALISTVKSYPPASLAGAGTGTSGSVALSGNAYGNGTYSMSCSSQYSTDECISKVFNFQTSDRWTTNGGFNGSTGAYTGSTYWTVSGQWSYGEWVKITLPVAIIPTSLTLTEWADRNATSFDIAGSTDGSTWDSIYTTGGLPARSSNTVNTYSLLGTGQAYSYFLYIVSGINPANQWGFHSMAEMSLSGAKISDIQPPVQVLTQYVVVGGGGGGGTNGGGGGGGGGICYGLFNANAGSTYTITVGAGGAGHVDSGNPISGSASSLSGAEITMVTALGGGGGASRAPSIAPNSGGSGGGGSGYYLTNGVAQATGAAGTSYQGSAGGNGYPTNYDAGVNNAGGGGGGYQSAGGSAGANAGGAGGTGYNSFLSDVNGTIYAGGGGGGTTNISYSSTTGGSGGLGGGGAGGYWAGSTFYSAVAGTPGTGGGGGGGGTLAQSPVGAAGGSGAVVLSVPTASFKYAYTGSPALTTKGASTVMIFTTSGTYTM
jgi:hypothetical protein